MFISQNIFELRKHTLKYSQMKEYHICNLLYKWPNDSEKKASVRVKKEMERERKGIREKENEEQMELKMYGLTQLYIYVYSGAWNRA